MTTTSAARIISPPIAKQPSRRYRWCRSAGRSPAPTVSSWCVRSRSWPASGIGQFIDLGTGLPTRPNVHEVARSVHPDARVLYVDNDPMVCSHARALLATNDGVAAIQGDIRTPQAILNDPVTRAMIDFTRPVGVLFVAVLHFLTDDDRPWEQVAAFRWRMASGSMLAVSHITSDGTPPAVQATIQRRLRRGQCPGSVPDQARDRELLRRAGSGRARPRGGRRLAQPAPISARAIALPRRRGQDHPRLRATMSPVPAPTLHPCQRAGMVVTPYSWPLSSSLELGALPTAVPCARLHAKHLAWEWGLSSITETIELLVSELTTNSVQAMAGQDDQPTIRLRLLTDSARVRIEVWDADPRPPAPKDPAADGMPDLEAEGGRGLFLVAALSTRWAWMCHAGACGQGRLV